MGLQKRSIHKGGHTKIQKINRSMLILKTRYAKSMGQGKGTYLRSGRRLEWEGSGLLDECRGEFIVLRGAS